MHTDVRHKQGFGDCRQIYARRLSTYWLDNEGKGGKCRQVRLRLDREDQYDPSRNKGAKCSRTSTEEQDFEALSGQLGCRASEPARNT